MFSSQGRIYRVVFNENITSIGKYAFANATDLDAINIPASVTSIGQYAFSNAFGVTAITFENGINLPKIEKYSFEGLTSLQTIHSNGNETINQFPASVTEIEEGALKNVNITTFVIADSVETIGEGVLSGAINLTTLTIPFIGQKRYATHSTNTTTFGWIFGNKTKFAVASGVYEATQNTVTYLIPNSLDEVYITDDTAIKAYGFANVSKVSKVILPDSYHRGEDDDVAFTLIGSDAFRNAVELTTIASETATLTNALPATITTIGNSAFRRAEALPSIVLSAIAMIFSNEIS